MSMWCYTLGPEHLGGHFAALEQPDLLVADIRKFFAKIDQKYAST